MNPRKPLFITLEGGDGTGKSTVAKALCERLDSAGQKVISTREPGGTPLGLQLRRILLQDGQHHSQDVQLLMLNAARLAHWQEVIRPALQSGTHVVCDRFVDSTRVYQALIHAHAEQAIERVNTLHHQFLPDATPDMVLILDVDPVQSLKRLEERPEEANYLDSEPLSFHQSVRNGFLHLAKQGKPYHLINADAPIEEVVQACWSAISGRN